MGGQRDKIPRIIIPELPVQNFMPASGKPFELASYVLLPNIGAQATVASGTVPKGQNGFIRRIANVFVGGGFQEGQGGVVWQILLDLTQGGGIVAPNFDNIVASLGSVANPSVIDGIHITEGRNFALIVKNISVVVAGQFIGGRLGGSFYPINLEPPDIAF
jgi:hypothetical protein